jgi:hypothetical protein
MKKIYASFLLLVTLMIHSSWIVNSKNLTYNGSAYDKKSSEFYYSEIYEEVMESNKHVATNITYKNSQGLIIGKKKLNFRASSAKPSFQMDDYRNGYMEGSEMTAEGMIKVFYRESKDAELISTVLNVPEPAVVDGGFNYFLKINWDKICSGQKVKFHFVAPEKQDYYSFRLAKEKEIIFLDRKAMVCKMEPENFILRQLVDPIMITYDIQTKRMLQYEGISNIRKSSTNDERYVVKIVYPNFGP